jgi:hypothetical protein
VVKTLDKNRPIAIAANVKTFAKLALARDLENALIGFNSTTF